uniref:Isopropylmalate dehydrogenase-like domain-containing protein n=1 Tax=Meloidogyne incognita TaxID=6306 RepID=A0A914MSA1_MELIC
MFCTNSIIRQKHTKTLLDFYRFKSALRTHILPKSKSKNDIILSKNNNRYTVTALPGDGIGPEMLGHIKRIFSSLNIPVDFNDVELNSKDPTDEELEKGNKCYTQNWGCFEKTKFDNPDFKSRNMELRRRLDLFANVLHCVSVPTIPTRHHNLDLVLIRENTEGEYSGLEHEPKPGIVESFEEYNILMKIFRIRKIVTRHGIERIARYAFDYAVLNNRPNITAIHKANIQKLGDGLFLK